MGVLKSQKIPKHISIIFVVFIFNMAILHIYFAKYYFWYNKALFRLKTGQTSQ